MTIKLAEGIKENYNKFSGGMAEEALHHVMQFWGLEIQLKYQKDYALWS